MIPYPILVLLLSATTVASTPPTIDWTECHEGDALCAVVDKCNNPRLTDATVDTYIIVKDDMVTCDTGLSIRPLSDVAWLLRLQIVRSGFVPAKGIQLIYDGKLVAGCVLKDGKTTLMKSDDYNVGAELYPADSSSLAPGHGFCSILMKDTTKLPPLAEATWRIDSGSVDDQPPVISLPSREEKRLFEQVHKKMKCKPLSLKWNPESLFEGYTKHEVSNLLGNTIDCSGVKDSKLFVASRYIKSFDEVTDFVCDKAAKKYTYKRKNEANGAPIDFEEEGNAKLVFCAIPIDHSCKPLPESALGPGIIKTNFTIDKTGKTSLSCPKTWIINDKFYFTGEAKCKNSPKSPSLGAWFIEKDGKAVEVKTAMCTERVNCTLKADNAPPKSNDTLVRFRAVSKHNGGFNCSDGFQLKVKQESYSAALTPSSISCDFTRGVYEMMKPEPGVDKLAIEDNANIYCEGSSTKKAPSGASVSSIVGAGVGGFIVLLVIIAAIVVLVIFYMARRRRLQQKPVIRRIPPNNHSDIAPPSDLPQASEGEQAAAGSVRSSRDSPVNTSNRSAREEAHAMMGGVKKTKKEVRPEYWPGEFTFGGEPCEKYIQVTKFDGVEWSKEEVVKLYYVVRQLKRHHKTEKFNIPKFMDMLNMMFEHELRANIWIKVMTIVVFLERELFHCNETYKHNIPEIKKKIPGFCYERFRLYLLAKADKAIYDYGWTAKDWHKQILSGADDFVRGISFVIKYKLNIMNKEEKTMIVNKLTDIFLEERFAQRDASRMFIWGILRHEDTGSKRTPGIYERFGQGNEQYTMFDLLLEEFKKELKKEDAFDKNGLLGRGTKVQHILFAMGCSLDRQAMLKVWEIIKTDKRFTAADYLFVMYGRDWLWDGAWVSMVQVSWELQFFVERFGTECTEYTIIAEMCFSYIWPDKYSLDAENGYCYEAIILQSNFDVDSQFILKWNYYYDRFEADLPKYGRELNDWLLKNDPREIEGYTPIDPDELMKQAEKRQKERDEEEAEELAKEQAEAAANAKEVTATAGDAPPDAAPAAAAPTKASSPSSSTAPSGSPTPAAVEPKK